MIDPGYLLKTFHFYVEILPVHPCDPSIEFTCATKFHNRCGLYFQ